MLVDLPSGGVEALSTLRDDRLGLCLDFSFDLGVSESLSLSLSLGFEGMARDAERSDRVGRWSQQGRGRGEMVSGLSKI